MANMYFSVQGHIKYDETSQDIKEININQKTCLTVIKQLPLSMGVDVNNFNIKYLQIRKTAF